MEKKTYGHKSDAVTGKTYSKPAVKSVGNKTDDLMTSSNPPVKQNKTYAKTDTVKDAASKEQEFNLVVHQKEVEEGTYSTKTKMPLSTKALMDEISAYGYTFSNKNLFMQMLFMVALVTAVGIFYKMYWWTIIIVAVVAIAMVPIQVISKYRQMYHQKRFNDVDIYLHQMIYSFQKMAKVSIALEDTYKITNGELHDIIGRAIDEINTSTSETVLEDALHIIELEYPTDRVKTLHKYLVSIEHRGGRYKTSLAVLLSDFDRWVKRVYKNQADIKQFKSESIIGLIITLVIGGATILIQSLMSGGDGTLSMDISPDKTYQAGCAAFLVVIVLYNAYVQVHYKSDWLKSSRPDEKIAKDYKLAFHTDVKKMQIASIPVVIIFFVIAAVIYAVFTFVVPSKIAATVGSISLVVVGCWIFMIPKFDKKAAMANLTNDVYIGFSEWLRDVALNLQSEPLQAAIEETVDECPIVMQESLSIFMKAIAKNPSAVEPYYEFMKEFNIMDIQSIVRTLYSIGDLDSEQADESINTLINRNYEIMDRHEEQKEDDRKAMRGFSNYVPMLFVTVKICIDMLAMMTALM